MKESTITIPRIIFLGICIVSILTFSAKLSKIRDESVDAERGLDLASVIIVALGSLIYIGICLKYEWERLKSKRDDDTVSDTFLSAMYWMLKGLPFVLLCLTLADTIPMFGIIDPPDRKFVILNICISCGLLFLYLLATWVISGGSGVILNILPCDESDTHQGWKVAGTISMGLIFVGILILTSIQLQKQSITLQERDNRKISVIRGFFVLTLYSFLMMGLCLNKGYHGYLALCVILFMASLITLIVLWSENRKSKEVITLDSIITIFQIIISLFITVVFALHHGGGWKWIAIVACLVTFGFGLWTLVAHAGENTMNLFRKLFYLTIFIAYVISLCPQSKVLPIVRSSSQSTKQRRSSLSGQSSHIITGQFKL